LLYQYQEPTGNAVIHRGLETRLQETAGLFLGFQWYEGATVKNWMVMEMDQRYGSATWSLTMADVHSDSQITGLSYSGSLGSDSYQRLYAVGRSGAAASGLNTIAFIDTTLVDGYKGPSSL